MAPVVVDAAELPTSALASSPQLGLKSEVMLHHAEASLQRLIVLVSSVQWLRAMFRHFHIICCC
jgi:hypothetical protein